MGYQIGAVIPQETREALGTKVYYRVGMGEFQLLDKASFPAPDEGTNQYQTAIVTNVDEFVRLSEMLAGMEGEPNIPPERRDEHARKMHEVQEQIQALVIKVGDT